jgi:hypothetical protein
MVLGSRPTSLFSRARMRGVKEPRRLISPFASKEECEAFWASVKWSQGNEFVQGIALLWVLDCIRHGQQKELLDEIARAERDRIKDSPVGRVRGKDVC